MIIIRRFFLLLSILASTTIFAGPVSKDEALQKARKFMPVKQFTKAKSVARSKAQKGHDAFYIFNAEGGGFVIVSGDDRTDEILGYSDKGKLQMDNIPENMRAWLNGYATQIDALDEDVSANPAVKANEGMPAIDPLLKCTWDQREPYSLRLPTYTDDEGNEVHYPTGCVATALAQVMYYHKWPDNCPSVPSYTTFNMEIFRPELPATTFKWNLMKDSYSKDDTGESADAVAELMEYIGQAIRMDYHKSGSSADIYKDVMCNIFGYNKNMQYILRSNYTAETWENVIYNELANGRPVLYDGYSNDGGHQFVCDGYDGDGLFHINWGWSGEVDGYFILSLANPSQKGIGGGEGSGGFAYNQSAILGFEPAKESDPEIPFFYMTFLHFEDAEYTRSSTNEDFVDVSTSGCLFTAYYDYIPTTTCTLEMGLALCQSSKTLGILSSIQTEIDNRDLELGANYLYKLINSISFGAGLTDGKYEIRLAYRMPDETDWNIKYERDFIVAKIEGNKLYMRVSDMKNVKYTVNDISYSGEMTEGTAVNVVVELTNTGDATQEMVYLWIGQNDSWKLVSSEIGMIEPGQTGKVKLSFTEDNYGEYDVKITSDRIGSQIMGTSTITIFKTVNVTVGNLVFSCNPGNLEARLIGNNYGEEEAIIEIPETVELENKIYKVTRIGNNAFENCRMTSITIPSSVEEIEKDAFRSCHGLKEITIPEGVTTINTFSFSFCSELNIVRLPSSLKAIGPSAFVGTRSLESVICKSTDPFPIDDTVFTYFKWEDGVSTRMPTTAVLYVPIGTVTAYSSTDGWKNFQKIVEMENAGEEESISPYAVYDDGTLTFYYDDQRSKRQGTTYDLNEGSSQPDWLENNANTTKAVFDASFADARPTSTYCWFYSFGNMTEIEGIGNLNTTDVTNMTSMFQNCSQLLSLDLSHFNTSNVVSMSVMFEACVNLSNLIVSHFDTENVLDMSGMFNGCHSLTSLDVSSFNTKNVSSMRLMFSGCSSLKVIIFGNDFVSDDDVNCEKVFLDSDNFKYVDFTGDIPAKTNSQFFEGIGTVETPVILAVPDLYKADYQAKFDGNKFFGGYFKLEGMNAARGDVDGDGEVDEDDINELANVIMNPSEEYSTAKDVNKDGVIDVKDIVDEVNIIMDYSCTGSGYFWMGTVRPTNATLPTLNGVVTTYNSLRDVLNVAPSLKVAAGSYTVFLCPSSWNVDADKVVIQDMASGEIYTLKKSNTNIDDHDFFETKTKISSTTIVVIKTKAAAEAYYNNINCGNHNNNS